MLVFISYLGGDFPGKFGHKLSIFDDFMGASDQLTFVAPFLDQSRHLRHEQGHLFRRVDEGIALRHPFVDFVEQFFRWQVNVLIRVGIVGWEFLLHFK